MMSVRVGPELPAGSLPKPTPMPLQNYFEELLRDLQKDLKQLHQDVGIIRERLVRLEAHCVAHEEATRKYEAKLQEVEAVHEEIQATLLEIRQEVSRTDDRLGWWVTNARGIWYVVAVGGGFVLKEVWEWVTGKTP